MRVTVVGCSGSFPGPGNPASCYLVEAGDTTLVLDLGSGALGELARYTDLAAVDAVLLSHLHADHCLDLCGYYVYRRYHPEGALPTVPVWGPEGTGPRLARAYDLDEQDDMSGEFEFREWADGSTVRIGDVSVTVARVTHPVACFAMRLEHDGAAVVYSGDTGPCDALVDLARGADLLLAEAAFHDGRDVVPDLHLTGSQAGAHAAAAGVRRLVLTHLPPWNDADVTVAEARTTWDGPLDVARPGTVYEVAAS